MENKKLNSLKLRLIKRKSERESFLKDDMKRLVRNLNDAINTLESGKRPVNLYAVVQTAGHEIDTSIALLNQLSEMILNIQSLEE